MPQEAEEEPRVDDVIVNGERATLTSEGGGGGNPSWLADLFGFDSGAFQWGDVGFTSGHVVVTVVGVSGAVPMGDEPGYVGVSGGLDLNITDGSVGVGVNGVSYDPSLEPGFNGNYFEPGYYYEIPNPTGGIGPYPVPGGDPGEHYWAPPPGWGGNESF